MVIIMAVVIMVLRPPDINASTLRAAAPIRTVTFEAVSSGAVIRNPWATPRAMPERPASTLLSPSLEFLKASSLELLRGGNDGSSGEEERQDVADELHLWYNISVVIGQNNGVAYVWKVLA